MVTQPRYSGLAFSPKVPLEPDHIAAAIRTVRAEIDGLEALALALSGDLRDSFDAAVEAIRTATGRVVVTGMGRLAQGALAAPGAPRAAAPVRSLALGRERSGKLRPLPLHSLHPAAAGEGGGGQGRDALIRAESSR